MTDHTNELRRLAQAATPGPWMLRTAPTSSGLCHIVSAADWRGAFIYGDNIRKGVDDALPKAQELAANARLIAAANPAAITELLDRLEAAEKERDALRAKIAEMEKMQGALRRHHEMAMGAGLDPSHSLTKLRVSAYQQTCLYADTVAALRNQNDQELHQKS